MTELEQEVRRRAADYVVGSSTIAEFELWLSPLAWSLNDQSAPSLRELVADLELRIAEFTSGAWSEDQLRWLVSDIAFPPATTSEILVVDLRESGETDSERSLIHGSSAGTHTECLAEAV